MPIHSKNYVAALLLSELANYFIDVCIVNIALVASFALRYELDVSLTIIYKDWSIFTFMTLVILPLSLRVFYYSRCQMTASRSLATLMKIVAFSFLLIATILRFCSPDVSRTLIILSTIFCFIVLSLLRGPFVLKADDLLKVREKNQSLHNGLNATFEGLRPKAEDLRSLAVGILSSIIAFLIIYYLLDFK